MKKIIFLLTSLMVCAAQADKLVLTDVQLLKKAGIPALKSDTDLKISAAILTDEQAEKLSITAHKNGRCAGYQDLGFIDSTKKMSMMSAINSKVDAAFAKIRSANVKANKKSVQALKLDLDPAIQAAIKEIDPKNIENTVSYLVNFGGRYQGSKDPNRHVRALADELKKMAAAATFPASVQVITHNRTQQNSLMLHLEGKSRPSEIVALGGHLDSINHEWGQDRNTAPGADDNASGSATIFEVARILLKGQQPERSIEIFWYAAEEVGLWGSTEIADNYSTAKKDVVGVMQLDMVLQPGSGVGTIASMTDFTSSWLRDYVQQVSSLYVGAKFVSDECGYGCSDHASWHSNGYPAVMPFEARMNEMNEDLHTRADQVKSSSSFSHAAVFAKLAMGYTMSLANSTLRAP